MEIDKRSRAELKQYFVKNAIPTEKNFAELIDGMLSQKDDGIAKLPGNPLSIEAHGDDASQKKAIHFYNNFADAEPAWVLSLNPRQNPSDAATAKRGFSIGDSAGTSRLFIDRDTGKIGVGTIGPLQAALHIDRGATNDLALMLSSSGPGWGSGLQLKNTPASGTAKTFGIYAGGGGLHIMDVDQSAERMVITGKGAVGIGTSTPQKNLHVQGASSGPFQNDEADRPGIAITGSYPELGLFSSVSNMYHGPTIRLGAYTDDTATAFKHWVIGTAGRNASFLDIGFSDKNHTNPHTGIRNFMGGKTILTLTEEGRVGIGTLQPRGSLDVPQGDAWVGRSLNLSAKSDGTNASIINFFSESTNKYWHITFRANEEDKLIFWRMDPSAPSVAIPALRLSMTGIAEAPQGAMLNMLGIGTKHYHKTNQFAYESIELYNTHNLRIVFGTTQRFMLTNGGDLHVGTAVFVAGTKLDLAEVTPVRPGEHLEQGDVVVIDREEGTRVSRSTRPYDSAVYGIVSSYQQAAMVIGAHGGPEEMARAQDKLPVALAGRVKVKVSAENGAIRAGDLLTTSSTPGHLMRCEDPGRHHGAIAGKALEPFAGETGVITVLVTLQ
jgi:hypothetical protein